MRFFIKSIRGKRAGGQLDQRTADLMAIGGPQLDLA
jgi:hypothetical protein